MEVVTGGPAGQPVNVGCAATAAAGCAAGVVVAVTHAGSTVVDAASVVAGSADRLAGWNATGAMRELTAGSVVVVVDVLVDVLVEVLVEVLVLVLVLVEVLVGAAVVVLPHDGVAAARV